MSGSLAVPAAYDAMTEDVMGVPNAALDTIALSSFPPLFVAMWFAIGAFLRMMSGFSWETSKLWRHEPRQASEYHTTARMGMTNFSSCLHIHRVRGGFLLQISRLSAEARVTSPIPRSASSILASPGWAGNGSPASSPGRR